MWSWKCGDGTGRDSGRPCCVTGTINDWLSYCDPQQAVKCCHSVPRITGFLVLLAVATVCCSFLRWLNCSISCRTTWTTEVCSAHCDRRGLILLISARYCSCNFGWSAWDWERNTMKFFCILVDRDPYSYSSSVTWRVLSSALCCYQLPEMSGSKCFFKVALSFVPW